LKSETSLARDFSTLDKLSRTAALPNVFKNGGDFYIINADGERLRICEIIEQ